MRILGADLSLDPAGVPRGGTIVVLHGSGSVAAVRDAASLADIAAIVAAAAAGEPFLLGVGLPVGAPDRPHCVRAVESVVLRRLGHRLRPRGRAPASGGSAGREVLLAALAVGGQPCLPYPDRDRRTSGLAEIHAALALKALLWEGSAAARESARPDRDEAFRGFAVPTYRAAAPRGRSSWAERGAALDLVLRALGRAEGYDFSPAQSALGAAASDGAIERAGSILDACVIGGTARRYLESPESCVFLGDRQDGYVILPADPLIRRLALRESKPRTPGLFPRGSLRERLGAAAEVQPAGLLDVPGRPQRTEAVFRALPLYEFDNLDEMLWWKHCRHLSGPPLPTEGLREITVALGVQGAGLDASLRLERSRHRTLSFRFEPPAAWRARVPTRDGKTYPFRVLRAIYETAAAD